MTKTLTTPKRDPEPELEGIRDDCIAVFLNSGMTQEEVHAAGGPTPGTISRWLYKETRFPQYVTVSRFLKACGGDLVAVSGNVAKVLRKDPIERRLGVSVQFIGGRPTMPTRKAARKAARKDARRTG